MPRPLGLGSLLIFALGCLPRETRQEPCVLAVTVRTAPGSIPSTGLVTNDGWTLRFERFIVGLGSAELDGSDCEPYGERGYGRILDVNRAELQPLSLSFGLGHCDLGLGLSGPGWDSLLGSGIAPEVAALLASPGTDTVRDDTPVSIYVEGHASQGSRFKRFIWPFRAEVEYEACRVASADGGFLPFRLRSGQRLSSELAFHPEALFRDDEQLIFAPFAAADDHNDSDDDITLAELAARPTLFEQIYFRRLPGLVQLPSGTCTSYVNREADQR